MDLTKHGAVPYLMTPSSEHEARYGKPVLLTDCQIAYILDLIQGQQTEGTDEERQAALDNIWAKLLPLWSSEPPYAHVRT